MSLKNRGETLTLSFCLSVCFRYCPKRHQHERQIYRTFYR